MSVDLASNLESPTPEEPKKKSRSLKDVTRSAKVRKHLISTVYKNEIADKLDKLHVAGHTILAITASSDVRGFEVVSYSEE